MADQQSTTTAVTIAGVEILQDAHGRYSLNTLHKASKASESKRPSRWLELIGTKELIAEMKSQGNFEPVRVIFGGNASGVYAHENLALCYAVWLCPSLQLKINQIFLQNGSLPDIADYLQTHPCQESLPKPGFVYVIQSDKYYKIGKSAKPQTRLRMFGVKSPYPLHVHFLIPTNDMDFVEKKLHARFASKRKDGEWFVLTDDDLQKIEKSYLRYDKRRPHQIALVNKATS